MSGHTADVIPVELRERAQWVVWRYQQRDAKTKSTKVLYRAAALDRKASSTNPATWADFEAARQAATVEGIDGIGFVVSANDPICGVDLDGCIGEQGEIHPVAASIIERLASYTEVSPSGTGLHVFVHARLSGSGRSTAKTPWRDKFEVYDRGRYLTVTGDHVAGTPATVEDRQDQLDALVAEMFPLAAAPAPRAVAQDVPASDYALIDRMFSARNGAAVRGLWNGDTSGHADDDSAADLALCSHLAYRTGGDADRVDALFRRSGLMRRKWDERRGETTYGRVTIAKAIESALIDREDSHVLDFAQAPLEPQAASVNGDAGRSGASVFTHPRIVDMAAAMKAAAGPLPYRVRPFALDATVSLLVGRAGESKTFLGLIACAGVQSGADVAPLACTPGRALYLDGENGSRQMARRFTLLGFDPDALTVADGTGLRLPRAIGEVKELVTGTGANLLVIDSLRRLAPDVREDKSDDVGPLMAALAQLARETGCAVVVIHHRSTKDHAADVRGSSTLEDQADVVFVLEKVKGDPERATRRRLRCVKMRPDREPAATWLRLKAVFGVMTIGAAEPFEADNKPPADEVVADEIRALASKTPADGWTPGDLAAAVGRRRDDKLFQAALKALLTAGEWLAEGDGPARRVSPKATVVPVVVP